MPQWSHWWADDHCRVRFPTSCAQWVSSWGDACRGPPASPASAEKAPDNQGCQHWCALLRCCLSDPKGYLGLNPGPSCCCQSESQGEHQVSCSISEGCMSSVSISVSPLKQAGVSCFLCRSPFPLGAAAINSFWNQILKKAWLTYQAPKFAFWRSTCIDISSDRAREEGQRSEVLHHMPRLSGKRFLSSWGFG